MDAERDVDNRDKQLRRSMLKISPAAGFVQEKALSLAAHHLISLSLLLPLLVFISLPVSLSLPVCLCQPPKLSLCVFLCLFLSVYLPVPGSLSGTILHQVVLCLSLYLWGVSRE